MQDTAMQQALESMHLVLATCRCCPHVKVPSRSRATNGTSQNGVSSVKGGDHQARESSSPLCQQVRRRLEATRLTGSTFVLKLWISTARPVVGKCAPDPAALVRSPSTPNNYRLIDECFVEDTGTQKMIQGIFLHYAIYYIGLFGLKPF